MHEFLSLLRSAEGGRKAPVMLLLRCPFDAMNTLIQAGFLHCGFTSIVQADESGLIAACAMYALASLLLFLYNGTVWSAYAAWSIRFMSALRARLFGHIASLSLRQIEDMPSGEWFTRLNANVYSASAIINQPLHLPHAATAAVGIAVSSAVLIHMSPAIFALVMAFVLPHMLVSQLFIARPMRTLVPRSLEAAARNATDLNALVTCADTAMLYDARGMLMRRFEEGSLALRGANMRMRARNAAGTALLPLMGMTGYLVLLVAASGWIARGDMTFGELTAAFQYRGGVLMGFSMLITSVVNIAASLAGARRVNATLAMEREE